MLSVHAISACYVCRWTSSWTRTGTCLGLTYWICYREARQRYIHVHSCRTELIGGGRLVISHPDSIIIIGDNHWRMISIVFHPTSPQFISALFSSEEEPGGSSSAAATSTRKKAPTVASKFSVSLSQLIAAMSKWEEGQHCVVKIAINLLSLGAILTLWDASNQILKRSACEGQIRQNQHSYHILLRTKCTLPSPHTH